MNETTSEKVDYNKQVAQLGARSWEEREAHWKTLREGGRATLSAMKQAFNHGDWRVRRECVGYMDHHADETCVRGLIKALQDPNQKVRRNAIHSLSCDRCKPSPIASDVIPFIIGVIENDRSIRVRRSALSLLSGRKPDPRITALLRKLLATESDVKMRNLAAWTLTKHTGEAAAN
jgi:HEAT repeat protein